MKRYGIMLIVLIAAAAIMTAPAAFAGDKMKSGQSTGMMQQSGMESGQGFHTTVRGSELIGKDVVNRNEEELGSVEDIIIGADGRLNYLVVSHGGVLGIGDNLIAVPVSAIDASVDSEESIVLNVSREELENAPNFAKTEWPDFADPSYENDVQGYFGTSAAGKEGGKMKEQKMEKQDVQPKTTD